MAINDKVTLARLLTRADEFLTFLDERWAATVPCWDDTDIPIPTKHFRAISQRFGHERKKLARGAMGNTARVKVLLASDIVAMFDVFRGVLYCTFFDATILLAANLNYSYEVKLRRTLESGQHLG